MKTDVLTPPDDLSEVARAKWVVLAAQVVERGCVMPHELLIDQLRVYCTAFSVRALALSQLAQAGLLLLNPNGTQYAHPCLKIVAECERTLDRVLRRLDVTSEDTQPEGIEL